MKSVLRSEVFSLQYEMRVTNFKTYNNKRKMHNRVPNNFIH